MIESTRVLSDLIRYETRLIRALDQALASSHGLAMNQYEILRLISTGEAMTVGELASVIGITTGAASKSVDRLEASGWIRRLPHPRNRRSSLLTLTTEGRNRLGQVSATVRQTVRPLLDAPLGREDLTAFAGMLQRLSAALD